jgi:hypothetical protein
MLRTCRPAARESVRPWRGPAPPVPKRGVGKNQSPRMTRGRSWKRQFGRASRNHKSSTGQDCRASGHRVSRTPRTARIRRRPLNRETARSKRVRRRPEAVADPRSRAQRWVAFDTQGRGIVSQVLSWGFSPAANVQSRLVHPRLGRRFPSKRLEQHPLRNEGLGGARFTARGYPQGPIFANPV